MKRPKNPRRNRRAAPRLHLLHGWVWRIIAGLTGAVFLAVLSFQALILLVNHNEQYQERVKNFLIARAPGSTSIESIGLGWENALPVISLRGIAWSDGSVSYLTAARGSVGVNLAAPLYGGSMILARLRQGSATVSRARFLGSSQRGGQLNLGKLDLALEDFELSVKENSAFYVQLDKLGLQLREGRLAVKSRGMIGYGVNRLADFSVSLSYGYGDDAVYAALQNIELDYGWHSALDGFGLPAEILAFTESVNSVVGSAQLWVDLKQSPVIKTRVTMEHLSFAVSPAKQVAMDAAELLASMELGAARPDGGRDWQLALQEFSFNLPNADQPARRLAFNSIQLTNGAEFLEIISPRQRAEDLSTLAVSVLSQENIVNNISSYDARGELENLYIRFNRAPAAAPKFVMEADVTGLTTNPVAQIPGFINASGELAIRDTAGRFLLAGENTDLFLPRLYPAPFHFGKVRALFLWEWIDPGELLLVGSSSHLSDGEMQGAMQLALHSIPTQHGYIDLEVGMQNADLQQIRSFIPWHALAAGTGNWLDRAFVGGSARSAALSLRGDTKYFGSPQTVFELGLSIADGELLYQEGEEPISAPRFDVFVDQEDVKVLLPQGGKIGQLAELDMGYGWVDIASGHFSLGGAGEIYLEHLPQVLSSYLLDGEPLTWQTAGRAEGNWEFQYNLVSNEFVAADFALRTADGGLRVPGGGLDLELTNIAGELAFSSEGYAGSWTADYGGNRLEGRFIDNARGNGMRVSAILAVPDALAAALPVSGAAEFTLEAYTRSRGDIFFSDYIITSDLAGIQSDFPYPLSKSEHSVKPLIFIGETRDAVLHNSLVFGSDVRLSWRAEGGSLSGLAVNIPYGRKQPLAKLNRIAKGILIDAGAAEPLDLNAWRRLLAELRQPSAAPNVPADGGNAADALLRQADNIYDTLWQYTRTLPLWNIEAAAVRLSGNEFRDIRVNYDAAASPWAGFHFATARGGSANGRLLLSRAEPNLRVDLYSLALKSADQEEESDEGGAANGTAAADDDRLYDLIPKSINPPTRFHGLPSVDLSVQSIFYDERALGNLNLRLRAEDYAARITVGDSKLLGVAVNSELGWSIISDTRSRITIALHGAGSIPEGALRGLRADDLRVRLNWQWEGRNREFIEWDAGEQRTQPTGYLSIRSSRGQIVSDRVNILTNIISFLNIDNLGARFTGDFSDLSTDEISYKDAELELDILGNEYTLRDEAKIILSFITIEAEGSYNLKEDELDLLVTVTSPTTKVLPLTALLLGASALTPLLLSIDVAGGDFINRFSTAVYQVAGPLGAPSSSLARIGDVSGKTLAPDDLLNQADVKSRLEGLRF